jgi:hypothetical protein
MKMIDLRKEWTNGKLGKCTNSVAFAARTDGVYYISWKAVSDIVQTRNPDRKRHSARSQLADLNLIFK